MVEQIDLSACLLAPLDQRVREVVLELLDRPALPAAWELLEYVEQKVGVKSRWVIRDVLSKLEKDKTLTSYNRSYITSLLSSDDLYFALQHEAPPRLEVESGIDALLRDSGIYQSSEKFQEMIRFMARFRKYSPFNNMLVKIQNPSCSFFATQKTWYEQFRRAIKEDAHPMIILAPRHPVLFVYALDQTVGGPLPEELERFAHFEGEWKLEWLKRAAKNAWDHYRIRVEFKTLSTTNAGFATIDHCAVNGKMRTVIHDGLDDPSRFGVLCHELAHILLGHLGCDQDHWWPSRIGLDTNTKEIEAEAVAYIVTTRFGLLGSSARYVSRYLHNGQLPDYVSLDMIATVAGRIERMTKKKLDQREPRFSNVVRAK